MIVIYTSPGCAGCRKLKAWLKDRSIDYVEKNIFKVLLNPTEIKHLLMRSENGTDDIISKRSKIIIENKIDIDSMSIDQLVNFIKNNPSILKRPIIISEQNFQVGYDAEEIDAFKPSELIKIAASFCNENCVNWEGCALVRKNEEVPLETDTKCIKEIH